MTVHEKAIAELQKIEPKIDLLHEILGCGIFAEVTQTSDGFWLGRERGDYGFNQFLGKPSQVAIERTWRFIEQLSDDVKEYVKDIVGQYQLD